MNADSKNLGRCIRWAPPLVWAGLIVWLSHEPKSAFPRIEIAFADKMIHFFLYAVLGCLVVRALTAQEECVMGRVRSAFVAGCLFAVSDEIHQIFVPGRSFQWSDLVVDAIGLAAGFWVWKIVSGRRMGNPLIPNIPDHGDNEAEGGPRPGERE